MEINEQSLEKILKTKFPAFPQFIFEWHPKMQKVYMIELPGEWIDNQFIPSPGNLVAKGTCIAEHCEHHARFFGFVQTYLRGYKKALTDIEKRNNTNGRKES